MSKRLLAYCAAFALAQVLGGALGGMLAMAQSSPSGGAGAGGGVPGGGGVSSAARAATGSCAGSGSTPTAILSSRMGRLAFLVCKTGSTDIRVGYTFAGDLDTTNSNLLTWDNPCLSSSYPHTWTRQVYCESTSGLSTGVTYVEFY